MCHYNRLSVMGAFIQLQKTFKKNPFADSQLHSLPFFLRRALPYDANQGQFVLIRICIAVSLPFLSP